MNLICPDFSVRWDSKVNVYLFILFTNKQMGRMKFAFAFDYIPPSSQTCNFI